MMSALPLTRFRRTASSRVSCTISSAWIPARFLVAISAAWIISTAVLFATPTGYIVDSQTGQDLEHTNNTKLWNSHGRWWCVAQDSSADDWFVYENNGPVPPTPGAQGGWAKTPVNIDNRNSARIDLWYNETEDVVHVLRMHSSGGTYNEYVWDSEIEFLLDLP